MTDKVSNQQISAAMDGEEDLAVLSRIADQASASETWRRYHLIGDALRSDVSAEAGGQLAERVALALEQEPAHAAPDALPKQGVITTVMPRWLTQPLSQVAVAATVAVVAIIGFQQMGTPTQPGGETAVTQTLPMAPAPTPVSLELNKAGDDTVDAAASAAAPTNELADATPVNDDQ